MIVARRLAAVVAVVLSSLVWTSAPVDAAPAVPAQEPGGQQKPIMLVVDTSGSMSEDDGTGRTRIEGARQSLLDFLEGLETGVRLGLRTYPAASGACDSGRLRVPVAPSDPADTAAIIRTLAPDGDTPTAEALRAAAADLRTVGAAEGTLILVSDGESTCELPCEAAEDIVAGGLDIDVISIGFQISPAGQEELECIAAATGGDYVDAADSEGLTDVLGDLAQPILDLDLSFPSRAVADVGTGPEGLVSIVATIANRGQLEARPVRAAIRFPIGESPGVAAPSRSLGVLVPGATTTVTWRFRPSQLLIGETVRFSVRVVAANSSTPATGAGTIDIDDAYTRGSSGPLLQDSERVVILGDSYSAGEGAHDYLDGTDDLDNGCHRSRQTYLAEEFDVADAAIIACSGALTRHLWQANPGNDVGSQLAELDAYQDDEGPADVVVLSMGGNDVGFSTVAKSCIMSLYSCDRLIWRTDAQSYIGTRLAALPQQLELGYRHIDRVLNGEGREERRGGQAPIAVLAYPRVVPGADRACPSLLSVSQAELDFINDMVTRLNAVVEGAVLAARQRGAPVYFVPDTEDAFLPDHTVCDRDPYANGLDAFRRSPTLQETLNVRQVVWAPDRFVGVGRDLQELLHPNQAGYDAMTRAVIRWSLSTEGRAAADLPVRQDVVVVNVGDTTAELLGPDGDTTVLLQGSTNELRPGSPLRIQTDGFAPGTPLDLHVESDPQALGASQADDDGRVVAEVALPDDLPSGRHEVVATGFAPDGEVREIRWVLEVPSERPLPWPAILASLGAVLAALGALGRRLIPR